MVDIKGREEIHDELASTLDRIERQIDIAQQLVKLLRVRDKLDKKK